MITRYGLLTKRPDVDAEKFTSHWFNVHGPIAMKARYMRHYYQNFVVDAQQRGVSFPRCEVSADAFSELWFDSMRDMNESMTPEIAAELAEDAKLIMSDVKILVTVKNHVIPIATDRPLVKRMSLIKRLPHVSVEQFKHEWWNVHGDFVRQFKGVRGYSQALIIDRIIDGKPVEYDALPVDGVVELYFDDVKALEQDFASEAGQQAQKHAKTFIEKCSTYLVERAVVLP